MNTTDALADIGTSVIYCNQRDVLKKQIAYYRDLISRHYPDADECRKIYYDKKGSAFWDLVKNAVLVFAIWILPWSMCIFLGELLFSTGISENAEGILGGIAIFGTFPVYHYLKKKNYKRFMEKHKTEIDDMIDRNAKAKAEIPKVVELMEKTRDRLAELEEKMRDDEICIIPEKYWDNANYIYNLIKEKRATDLVSAINVFETIMHQLRMENMAQESLEYQQIAAYNSEIAAENSRIAAEEASQAAFNSGIAAIYSAANYYNN